jgi:hypothetical protein
MARSRSLFDDLDLAIATATSLTAGDDPKSSSQFLPSAPLVSFEQPIPSMPDPRPIERRPPFKAEEKAPEKVASRPAEKVASKPAEKPIERPAEPAPGEGADDNEADRLVNAFVEMPADQPAEEQVERPAPKPAPKPADRSATRPPQTLVARVADAPAPKPAPKQPAPTLRGEIPLPPPPEMPSLATDGGTIAPPPPGKASPSPAPAEGDHNGEKKVVPPKLPDLSNIASPMVRCEKIVSWIGEATGATEVFLADSAGYPLAGSIIGVEAKLANVGLLASSIASLAASIPGNISPLFEMHVGDGPFFQVIGFQAGASVYIVGFSRGTPLTPRQSHAIRLACRHALGDTLRGGLWESE